MARYILIDNFSGFIWGDSANLEGNAFNGTPLEFAAALDTHVGPHTPRVYEDVSRDALASNESGYHVYRAGDAIPIVQDGSDEAEIEAVTINCEYVTTIRYIDADEAA